MNWIFGANPLSSRLIQAYWQTDYPVRQEFLAFQRSRQSPILGLQDCLELRNLTYLSEELPFGRVDAQPRQSKVATDEPLITEFAENISQALRLLESSPSLRLLSDKAVKSFVPITGTNENSLRADGSGMSVHWLKGSVFLSLPEELLLRRLNLALNLSHELGHQVLMIFQDCDCLIRDIHQPVYSAVRRTERPAIMSFHALMAVYFMLEFTSSIAKSPVKLQPSEAAFIVRKQKELQRDFIDGIYALKTINFTPIGLSLFDEMIRSFSEKSVAS